MLTTTTTTKIFNKNIDKNINENIISNNNKSIKNNNQDALNAVDGVALMP